jgi:deoxyhypusine synthase
MPFLVKALLDNRARYERMAHELGEARLFEKEPKARGYLRPLDGYRLFEHRDELCDRLREDVRANKEWLMASTEYPLAGVLTR